MQLPNAASAVVDPVKVRDYVLSLEHPVGRAKARFFQALGFTGGRWVELQAALIAVAGTGEAVPSKSTVFGQMYVVRGMLQGPTGLAGSVVTMWIVRRGEGFPRFVTAYPEAGR